MVFTCKSCGLKRRRGGLLTHEQTNNATQDDDAERNELCSREEDLHAVCRLNTDNVDSSQDNYKTKTQ